MLKPAGARCNLACRYCFYLEKEALYPGAAFHMSDAVLESFTRQYIASQPGPEITFAWQGGEPMLLGLDFYRRAVALQGQCCPPGKRIANAFQTNGTLLDDAWCVFFHEHGFLVGLSLDGPRRLHDRYRVDKGGRPTFDRVMAGLALLRRHRVEFNILCCVHAGNADRSLEVYRFLRDEAGAQFIQFIPIVEPAGHGEAVASPVSDRSVSGPQYGEFLCRVFDEWVRRDVGRVFVQIFDAALGIWLGRPASLCLFAETCGRALALEHTGDLYACDHFVTPAHRLGNIADAPLAALAQSRQQAAFGQAKQTTLPRACRECPVRFACHSECPKNRLLTTADGEPGLNYLCEGYKRFFTHIAGPMERMAELLRAGRPAAEVMATSSDAPRGARRAA
jgi:uncharacterized protein